jgi:hypothetical protein
MIMLSQISIAAVAVSSITGKLNIQRGPVARTHNYRLNKEPKDADQNIRLPCARSVFIGAALAVRGQRDHHPKAQA